ncbi:MAG: GTPase Era [Myxococcales bacterium]
MSQEPHHAGTVAIVGRPNVGKSTLLNALLGEPIAITSPHPQTTRDQILGVLTRPNAQFVFLDTPGIHTAKTRLGVRMNALALGALDQADVVVLLTQIKVGPVPQAAKCETMSDADRAILKALPPSKPIVLALNKVDRLKNKPALLPVLEAHAKEHPFAALVPISALHSNGTDRLLDELQNLLPVQPKLFDDQTLSDKPVRFFVAEFVREQILRKTREEVPHGVAVVVERFDEAGPIPRIELTIHVDKDSHKKILIGARGELLKAIGTEARERVEAMLGKHVFLKLWVRVTPGWYTTDQGLSTVGYTQVKSE